MKDPVTGLPSGRIDVAARSRSTATASAEVYRMVDGISQGHGFLPVGGLVNTPSFPAG